MSDEFQQGDEVWCRDENGKPVRCTIVSAFEKPGFWFVAGPVNPNGRRAWRTEAEARSAGDTVYPSTEYAYLAKGPGPLFANVGGTKS